MNFYFERLNHHYLYIPLSEAEVRRLYNEYLRTDPDPSYIMWCIFLAKKLTNPNNGVLSAFYEIEKPQSYMVIK